jgi:predicted membrane chloride channel (bestrophin family)
MFCVLLPFGLASSLGWGTPVLSAVLAYAFFGLDQLGEKWKTRSAWSRTTCLDALVRTIEIDQLDALGERRCPNPCCRRATCAIATPRSLPCPTRCTARAACATTSSRAA